MDIIIGCIVIFCFCFLPGIITEVKFNNRTISDSDRINWDEMNRELACGKPLAEVKRKYNAGQYDTLK